MLDPILIACEVAAVSALAGLADAVTRRKVGYIMPKTGYCELDVTILPTKSEGHPLGGAMLEATATIRVIGRGPDGTAVLDRVRYISDLAAERLMADPVTAKLFGHVPGTAFERDMAIEDGAVVIVEEQEITVSLQHISGAGAALGIVEAMDGSFPAGHALGALAKPAVYAAGMDTVLAAPASVTALFAGITGGAERLELRDAAGAAVDSVLLSVAAGTHSFADVADGDYTLVIVRVADDEDLATSPPIRVRAAP